jgi:hypothetical protein
MVGECFEGDPTPTRYDPQNPVLEYRFGAWIQTYADQWWLV